MQIIEEPVSAGDADKLRRWLDDPAFSIFQRVVESMAFKHEATAAEHLLKDSEAANKVAKDDVERAVKARHVLTLMRQLRAEKQFYTAKAVPTTMSKL